VGFKEKITAKRFSMEMLSVGEGLAPPADYNEREAKRLPYKQISAEGCSSADFVL